MAIRRSRKAKPAKKRAARAGAQGRISLGIPGLDKLLDDGVPQGSIILLPGCVGSGKTVFSLHFLAEGALRFGERGLFISFEEYEGKLREQAGRFGWDFDGLERKGLLKVMRLSSLTLGEVLAELQRAIDTFRPQRLVIDSFTYLTLFAQARTRIVELEKILVDEVLYEGAKNRAPMPSAGWNTLVVKKMATDLVLMLQGKGITTILTSEISKNSDWYSRDTVSEFACDGVFLLKLTSIGGNAHRTIELVKLRNTPLRCGIFNFDITQNGIAVRS